MLSRLVQSALQNGYLSVESEGLIRQIVAFQQRSPADLQALEHLLNAVNVGQVRREAQGRVEPLQQLLWSAITIEERTS